MTIGIFNVTFIYTYPCLVPDPVFVAVTSDPVSIIEYPDVTLTCTVELSPAVDVPVTVNTVWTGPAGFIIENTAQRVNESNTRYISTAIVRSLNRNEYGNYTCLATVISKSPYINNSSLSGIKIVSTGKIYTLRHP